MNQSDILSFTYIFLIVAGTISVAGLILVYLDKKSRLKLKKKAKK